MHFLDIDLDAFLSGVVHWPDSDSRPDPEAYIPWTEYQVRHFLEEQCGLSRHDAIDGWFVENHDGAFDVMTDLIANGSGPLDVVHVDAHADLGMGDASWVDMIEHVARPLAERRRPRRGTRGLNLGSWLAYAIAAEYVRDLTYVYPRGWGNDLPPLYFPGGDKSADVIEMKAYTRSDLPSEGGAPDYHKLYHLPPDLALAPVPFRMVTLDEFTAGAPFDIGLLCRSPEYTPESSDRLIPVIGEYIRFRGEGS